MIEPRWAIVTLPVLSRAVTSPLMLPVLSRALLALLPSNEIAGLAPWTVPVTVDGKVVAGGGDEAVVVGARAGDDRGAAGRVGRAGGAGGRGADRERSAGERGGGEQTSAKADDGHSGPPDFARVS